MKVKQLWIVQMKSQYQLVHIRVYNIPEMYRI
jgi:hypothetical protein